MLQAMSYNCNNCASYLEIDQRFADLLVTEYSKHYKSQFQTTVIQCDAGETKVHFLVFGRVLLKQRSAETVYRHFLLYARND